MAVPTLTALEEEKKQAQAADEELQVRLCRCISVVLLTLKAAVLKGTGTALFAT
jgi:hypothetical protein